MASASLSKGDGQPCYQDPIYQELSGNAIDDCAFDNGKGIPEGVSECDWDGTADDCQLLCLNDKRCRSVNYYEGKGGEAHECVFHDKTCDDPNTICEETMDTEYYEPQACDE